MNDEDDRKIGQPDFTIRDQSKRIGRRHFHIPERSSASAKYWIQVLGELIDG